MIPTIDAALAAALRRGEPMLWLNPAAGSAPVADEPVGPELVHAARQRFRRFAPALQRVFPELQASEGRIASRLVAVPELQAALGLGAGSGRLFVKADHELPVAGSIKARGGLHEVLEHTEQLGRLHGLLGTDGDALALVDAPARAVLGAHEIAVGSTGNLGLSIGMGAAAFGYRATVHMSADAKAWKKERLRRVGVRVVEHEGDYARAVARGRAEAAVDPRCHFVDDERSRSLLAGYATAAAELQGQLQAAGVAVSVDAPLFVYLPCGVGGAPAGIAWGLKLTYGDAVHCFFAEPTRSPCLLVGLAAVGDEPPSVYDVGLDNRTEADGLAVPRASALACTLMRPRLAGVLTVDDDTLFEQVALARRAASLRLEPSAAAGLGGPGVLVASEAGRAYLDRHRLAPRLARATHVAWTTGGALVPDAPYAGFVARGEALLARRITATA
jgi:D-serine dehydratase